MLLAFCEDYNNGSFEFRVYGMSGRGSTCTLWSSSPTFVATGTQSSPIAPSSRSKCTVAKHQQTTLKGVLKQVRVAKGSQTLSELWICSTSMQRLLQQIGWKKSKSGLNSQEGRAAVHFGVHRAWQSTEDIMAIHCIQESLHHTSSLGYWYLASAAESMISHVQWPSHFKKIHAQVCATNQVLWWWWRVKQQQQVWRWPLGVIVPNLHIGSLCWQVVIWLCTQGS